MGKVGKRGRGWELARLDRISMKRLIFIRVPSFSTLVLSLLASPATIMYGGVNPCPSNSRSVFSELPRPFPTIQHHPMHHDARSIQLAEKKVFYNQETRMPSDKYKIKRLSKYLSRLSVQVINGHNRKSYPNPTTPYSLLFPFLPPPNPPFLPLCCFPFAFRLQCAIIKKSGEISMNLIQSNDFTTPSANSILQAIGKNGYNYSISNQIPCHSPQTALIPRLQLSPEDQQALSGLNEAIGVVRMNWRNRKGEIRSINYGTAFAVNSKMVLTCTHNLFSQKHKTLADEIVFLPNIDGPFKQARMYRCTKKEQIRCRIPEKEMIHYPLREELALFVLDEGEELQCKQYVKVGVLEGEQEGRQLKVVGYPSKDFFNKLSLEEGECSRVSLRGQLYNIEDYIVHHTLATSVGHSGSPILAKDRANNHYAIGMHTHRGFRPQFNSGLYFSPEILDTLRTYQQQLCPFPARDIFHGQGRVTTPDQYVQQQFDPGIDPIYEQIMEQQCKEYLNFKVIDLSPVKSRDLSEISIVSISSDGEDNLPLPPIQCDLSDFLSFTDPPSSKLQLSLFTCAQPRIPRQNSQTLPVETAEEVYDKILIEFLGAVAGTDSQDPVLATLPEQHIDDRYHLIHD